MNDDEGEEEEVAEDEVLIRLSPIVFARALPGPAEGQDVTIRSGNLACG